MIKFLDELGNFKQNTLGNVKLFYILKQWTHTYYLNLFVRLNTISSYLGTLDVLWIKVLLKCKKNCYGCCICDRNVLPHLLHFFLNFSNFYCNQFFSSSNNTICVAYVTKEVFWHFRAFWSLRSFIAIIFLFFQSHSLRSMENDIWKKMYRWRVE